jgi:hypothetical protein
MAQQRIARRQIPAVHQVQGHLIQVTATIITALQLRETQQVSVQTAIRPITPVIMRQIMQIASMVVIPIITVMAVLQLTTATEVTRQIPQIQAHIITEPTMAVALVATLTTMIVTMLRIRPVEPTPIIHRTIQQMVITAILVVHMEVTTTTRLRILQTTR